MTVASPEILYAADLEEGSEAILAYAISVANRLGAKLHVVIGIPDLRETSLIEVDSHVPQDLLDKYHDDRAKRAKKHVEDQIHAFYAVRMDAPARPIHEVTVREGDDIGGLVLDQAKKVEADLIIMASRGEGALSALLFGSVVQDVVRETTIPVLLVPMSRYAGDEA